MGFTENIRKIGDPVLHQRSADITDFRCASLSADRKALQAALRGFQVENGFGRAIAAPQFGFPLRMIAVSVPIDTSDAKALFAPLLAASPASEVIEDGVLKAVFVMHNPVVEHHEDSGSTVLWDDCFSFPHVLVRVQRTTSVSVTFTLEDGETMVSLERLPLSLSELIQHEADHLDGMTSFDRIPRREDTASPAVNVVYRTEFLKNPSYFNTMVDVPFTSTAAGPAT